ncbi:LLM class flavin-dependent oxidoreductase [Streptomyces blattellae]|uniref:LLM class flavin-dependent oxidoreductase n=1 Tax=Streptomyces blattellae TaxID=2569855 RepID=UPI001E5243A0|nr:LLM class flavin-dependent oxidoreductase [Streptomyces blattellae]
MTMNIYYFTEAPYPHLPPAETYPSVRNSLPNGLMDPDIAADLWDRYLLEWQIADEAGLNVMVNEHHSTPTCLNSTVPVSAAVLARLTKNARILILGNPVANRNDPVRIAEEMAMIDILSRGRLDVGFVRGVPFEIAPTNSAPTMMSERLYEGIDLIRKAWTSHDGPFNWEGRFYHSRQVNIWPRPYQQPAPPMWVSTTTPSSVRRIADYDATVATFMLGHEGTAKVFAAYRERAAELGRSEGVESKLAYCGLVYTGKTDAEGLEGARKLLWYLKSNKVTFEYAQPPAYGPYAARAEGLRGVYNGFETKIRSMSLEGLIDNGTVFAGSPETVRGQIERFYELVGGYGNMILMGQAGFMGHDETVAGIRTFADKVLPNLAHLQAGAVHA